MNDQLGTCPICASSLSRTVRYDKHGAVLSLKGFVKSLLPYFDLIIPNSAFKLKKYSARRLNPFGGFVNICSNCRHGVMQSPPSVEQLEKYYKQLYWSQRDISDDMDQWCLGDDYKNDPRARAQISLILPFVGKSNLTNILEIGAGHAYASLLLRHRLEGRHVTLYACEPGEQWVSYYKKADINKISNFFPFESDLRFDYIHTSHWLEHMSDINATLLALKDAVSRMGFIFVEVPNTDHEYWDLPGDDTPHIQFFTPKSLKELYVKHGFKCLVMEECGIPFNEYSVGKFPTESEYGSRERGFWIRALFQKV